MLRVTGLLLGILTARAEGVREADLARILHDHPAVQAGERWVLGARAGEDGAGARPDPVVSVGLMNYPLRGEGLASEPMAGFNYGIQRELLPFRMVGLRVDVATAGRQGAEARVLQIRRALLLDVRLLFWELAMVREEARVLAQAEALVGELRSILVGQLSAGQSTSGVDLAEIDLKHELLREQVAERRSQAAALERTLDGLMAVDLNYETPSPLPVVELRVLAGPIRPMLEQGWPEFRLMQAEQTENVRMESLARLEGRPELGLGVSYLDRPAGTTGHGEEARDLLSVELMASLPFGGARVSDAEAARARAAAEARGLERESLLRAMEAEVQAAALRQADAQARARRLREELIPQAERIERMLRDRLSAAGGEMALGAVLEASQQRLELEMLAITAAFRAGVEGVQLDAWLVPAYATP
jgi:cobalt-zinc-cadmium efflux system outer membrane protein